MCKENDWNLHHKQAATSINRTFMCKGKVLDHFYERAFVNTQLKVFADGRFRSETSLDINTK